MSAIEGFAQEIALNNKSLLNYATYTLEKGFFLIRKDLCESGLNIERVV